MRLSIKQRIMVRRLRKVNIKRDNQDDKSVARIQEGCLNNKKEKGCN